MIGGEPVNGCLSVRLANRNYVGTLFGGSLFGAVDPMNMIMLIDLLGPEYVVWDKARQPSVSSSQAETLVYATFQVEDAELADIQALLLNQSKIDAAIRLH